MKLAKYFLGLVLLSFIQLSYAQDVVVETNPRNPVKGEAFQILFKCQTTKNVDPEITFEAEGFEVLGKQSQGLSVKTVYQQGRIQTSRELLVSYEAMAPKAGRINLRNLVVVLDGKRMTQAVVGIQVLDAPVEPRHVFVAAEVSKKSAYVGEGITVRYHIYTKTNLQAFDIKKYSKLDGFMKRFLQEPDSIQRVTVDGESYRRSVIYAARVYPERAGKLIVDPMEISATYGGDPFGMGFGFGGGSTKTRQFSSEPVEVEVKALPTNGRPANFNGLVGRHVFDLKANGAQILVNEPLEVRLSISGPGNLENLEAPELWSVPQLDRFDAKSDLSLNGSDAGIKTFDYTYLGKAPGEVPARDIEFTYFEPTTQKYEVVKKKLPEVIVGGSASPIVPTPATETDDETPIPQAAKKGIDEILLKPGVLGNPLLWIAALASLAIIGLFIKARSWQRGNQKLRPAWELDLAQLQKKELTSAALTRILHALSPSSTQPLSQILAGSRLPAASQDYFLKLLMQLERREFATKRPTGEISLEKKHLSELRKALKGIG